MGDSRTVELPPGPDGEPHSAQMTNLEWALKYVKLKVQQMVSSLHPTFVTLALSLASTWPRQIFAGRKTDRCGVVLFGTAGAGLGT